jgi:hypothetical protein
MLAETTIDENMARGGYFREGEGACRKCDCQRFTWASFVEEDLPRKA